MKCNKHNTLNHFSRMYVCAISLMMWFISYFDLIFACFCTDEWYHLSCAYLYNKCEDRWAAVRSSRQWRWHPLRSGQCSGQCPPRTYTPVMQDGTNHMWHKRKQGRMSKAKSVTHCSLWCAGHVICTTVTLLWLCHQHSIRFCTGKKTTFCFR